MVKVFRNSVVVICLLCCSVWSFAQVNQGTLSAGTQRDTSMNKSNTGKWKDEDANISFEKLNSARVYYPDTAVHSFHRPPFTQPWYRDLGNLGSPASNLLFTADGSPGPSLGYRIFDIYRYKIDSLTYYNTQRPYSIFNYQLGSKLEQTAGIMHTQNILPNWNFAIEYRKTNSPGFYKTQRNNNDNAYFTTNYKGPGKHYSIYMGMVYNKEQHDENGGIVNDSDLSNASYSDKKTIYTAYQNSVYSASRSPVTNVYRDFTYLLQHSYVWGKTDTTYNSDSTQYSMKLLPRFSIAHTLEVSTEKHTYKDLSPDSLRYTTLFQRAFAANGTGYTAGNDSVFVQQKWFWVDNKFLLNGFIGKPGRQLLFNAGFGTRYDQFISQPVSVVIPDSLPKLYYTIGNHKSDMVNNYLTGEVKKEALQQGQWEYGASAKFFVTGEDAGDFLLNVLLGKEFKKGSGSIVAGFKEQLNSAPYSYTNYENKYVSLVKSFNKESVTSLFISVASNKLKLSGGFRNYVIANYLYINEQELPDQNSAAFTINQLWGRKTFKMGNVYLDNELVFQQIPDEAHVNAPPVMGRHQLSFEKALFKRRLKLATGIEVRYNSAYNPAGYDALLNKFFYQTKTVSNTPELALFLNFRIKKFRAFVMGDNLQQLFSRNTILYTGTPVLNFNKTGVNNTPVYSAPDALIRFGFTWVLVN